MSDEIIEELWRIKDGIAREHGYDVERLAAGLRSREPEPGRRVVDLRAVREARGRGAPDEPRSGDGESPAQPPARRSPSGGASGGA